MLTVGEIQGKTCTEMPLFTYESDGNLKINNQILFWL